MDEELPRRTPTSLSQELRFTEENEPPTSYLFESPGKWRTKVGLSEGQGSASPRLSPNRSRTLGHLSGDDVSKEPLFTFPRLYSDLTSERDPFFDCRGMPLNPHNTPISQSGRPSETGSVKNAKPDAPSPTGSERQHSLSSDVAYDDDPLISLLNGRESAWRPPKPPKPPFLSDPKITARCRAENLRSSLGVKLPKSGDKARSLPQSPHRSLPISTSWNLSQPVTADQKPSRPKPSWESRSIFPCRYFPRPFTNQELEVLGIPLNKGIPFPAPIPTIDKLPLRRGIIKFDKDGAGQCLIDTDSSSNAETGRSSSAQGSSSIWQNLQQIMETAIHYLSPHQTVHCASDSRARTTITIPFASKCEACPGKSGQAAALGPINGAYILQANIAFPLLFARRSTTFAAAIHSFLSSKIVITTAFSVWSLICSMVRSVLFVFGIEVSVEIKRI